MVIAMAAINILKIVSLEQKNLRSRFIAKAIIIFSKIYFLNFLEGFDFVESRNRYSLEKSIEILRLMPSNVLKLLLTKNS